MSLPASRADDVERIERAYWSYLSRISLRLLRVARSPDDRTVALLLPAFHLFSFGAPEYLTAADYGEVTWPIRRGLLVAREGHDRGYLRLAVRRVGADPHAPGRDLARVRMEVRDYYPSLRGSGSFARFGTWFYTVTQLRIHALITRGFLRSLTRWT